MHYKVFSKRQSIVTGSFTLAHWWVLWYLNIRDTPIRPKRTQARLFLSSIINTEEKKAQHERQITTLFKLIQTFATCLSKGGIGQRALVFALGEQRDDDAAADLLHLVGPVVGLAEGPENVPHPPPVLLAGTKLPKTFDDLRGEKSLENLTDVLQAGGGKKPTLISTMA